MDTQQAEQYADLFFNEIMLQMRRARRPLPQFKDFPPPSQAALLAALDAHGPMRVADIAEALHMTSPGASSLVNELVKAGWASRSEHPEDRRIKIVQLTPEGRGVAERFTKARREMLVSVLTRLEPAEIEPVLAVMRKVMRLMNEEFDKH